MSDGAVPAHWTMTTQDEIDRRIQRYYADTFDESARLTTRSAGGRVELLRTRALLARHIAPGATVLDVGGATGVHAGWLAERGHPVTLVDPVAAHVAAASRLDGVAAEVGDARSLRFADASVDAVLLLGPLYHLRSVEDRVTALAEARRVLRPGGVLLAGAITRTSVLLDVVVNAGFEDLPGDALARLLATGESPLDAAGRSAGFPAAHFHTAAELRAEVVAAGFDDAEVVGIEGPGSVGLDLSPADAGLVTAALAVAERLPADPRLVDLSSHLVAVARV